MKLTRKELLCAQDRQLSVLGLTRKQNPGWLKQALGRDWHSDFIAAFHAARKPTKADKARMEKTIEKMDALPLREQLDVAKLRLAIRRLRAGLLVANRQCWNIHHDSDQYHEPGQPCPVEAQLNALLLE